MYHIAFFIVFMFGITAVGVLWYYFAPTTLQIPKGVNITFENTGHEPQSISYKGYDEETLYPGDSKIYVIPTFTQVTIVRHYMDKSTSTSTITIKEEHANKTIKLTDTNISTKGSTNIPFLNLSTFPIIIVEWSSKGGRRWGSDIIAPSETYMLPYVDKGSSWEVVHPTDEQHPITKANASGKSVKRMVFDGVKLIIE